MIIEERNRKPFINFGFNIVSKTETTNKDIDVYLDTLYNLDRYNSFTFTAPSANVTKINDYYYKVSYFVEHSLTFFIFALLGDIVCSDRIM